MMDYSQEDKENCNIFEETEADSNYLELGGKSSQGCEVIRSYFGDYLCGEFVLAVDEEKQRRNTIAISPQTYLNSLSACVVKNGNHVQSSTESVSPATHESRATQTENLCFEDSQIIMSGDGGLESLESKEEIKIIKHCSKRNSFRCNSKQGRSEADLEARFRKRPCTKTVVLQWRHSISETIIRAKETNDTTRDSSLPRRKEKKNKRRIKLSAASLNIDAADTHVTNIRANYRKEGGKRADKGFSSFLCGGSGLLNKTSSKDASVPNDDNDKPRRQITKEEKRTLQIRMQRAFRKPEKFTYFGDI